MLRRRKQVTMFGGITQTTAERLTSTREISGVRGEYVEPIHTSETGVSVSINRLVGRTIY